MLRGSEINGVIPYFPFKGFSGIEYREFTDYKTGMAPNELPLHNITYWHTLEPF
jgi:hypothetical protein